MRKSGLDKLGTLLRCLKVKSRSLILFVGDAAIFYWLDHHDHHCHHSVLRKNTEIVIQQYQIYMNLCHVSITGGAIVAYLLLEPRTCLYIRLKNNSLLLALLKSGGSSNGLRICCVPQS